MQPTDNISALRNLSALVDFSNLINSSLELNFILNNLILTCFGKFHTTKGMVALADENKILKVEAAKGYSKDVVKKFPEISIDNFCDNPAFISFINHNKVMLWQEIISSNGSKGVFLLGERLLEQEYLEDDKKFINTILNIASTAIENSLSVGEIKFINRSLDSKVNQLTSLFDLSKEFSGILDVNTVGRLLVFSIIGQMLVSKFAIVIVEDSKLKILDTRVPNEILISTLNKYNVIKIDNPLNKEEILEKYPGIFKIGIELIIPMQIQGETKGLILLGSRKTNQDYTRSDIEFVSSVGSLAIISIENARLFKEILEKQRMEKDLEIARDIQKSLFPASFPKMKNFEISAYNDTAKRVGGDYYDLVKLDKNRVLFAVGDVSGKGVQAALLMANLQAFLKSIWKQNIALDEASNLINDLVSENTKMGNFITFFWGIINDDTKELSYVNAGHNPPLLIRNGEIRKLKLGGMILGVMKTTIPYQSEIVQLESGDAIVLFTDGITEAMNIKEEEFTDEKFEEIVSVIGDRSSEEILNTIIDQVNDFTQGAEQSDDITCLVIKVN